MKTFNYKPISKFYFRYANMALSMVLLTYFVVLILEVRSSVFQIIPALINLLIVYAINKYYIGTYKELPFEITIEADKLIASNFMFGKKAVEIKYNDIDEITGGVFGYNPKGLIYVHDGENNLSISIHPSIENADRLLRLILSRVKKELCDEAVKKLKPEKENK